MRISSLGIVTSEAPLCKNGGESGVSRVNVDVGEPGSQLGNNSTKASDLVDIFNFSVTRPRVSLKAGFLKSSVQAAY